MIIRSGIKIGLILLFYFVPNVAAAEDVIKLVNKISNIENSDDLAKIYATVILKASFNNFVNASITSIVDTTYKGRRYYMANAKYDGIDSRQDAMVIFQVCYWGPIMILADSNQGSDAYSKQFISLQPDFIAYEEDHCFENK